MGIEPTTYSLGSCRSTTELRPRNHVQGFKLERPFISASHEFSNSTAAGRSVFMMSPRQCSTKMIHKTPKRSVAIAKRGEKNVFVGACMTLPPSLSAANSRSTSPSSARESVSEKP